MILLTDMARPGVMISQVWPDSREKDGETLKAIEYVIKEGFFTAFQTVEIPYPKEREKIRNIIEEGSYPLTYCLARVLNENKLNLSDLDQENRKRSYEKVIECLGEARELGATSVALISGPKPEDDKMREKALDYFKDSLRYICAEAGKGQKLNIIIEPIDAFKHKKNTLGFTKEAVDICNSLKKEGLDLWLCIDTAHMILNDEDVIDSLKLAQDYVLEFHYCNCVTDKDNPLYGDRHIKFGSPGVVDVDLIAQFMKKSLEVKFFNEKDRPLIFCEVLKTDKDDSVQVLNHCRNSLEEAWKRI